VQVVVFDKTGTLTAGRPAVQACVGPDVSRLLWAAACCEASSEHPLALAVVQAHAALPARQKERPLVGTAEFEAVAGEGLRCVLADSSRARVLVGNERLMQHFGVVVSEEMKGEALAQAAQARTVVFVAGWGGFFFRPRALFCFVFHRDPTLRERSVVGRDCDC